VNWPKLLLHLVSIQGHERIELRGTCDVGAGDAMRTSLVPKPKPLSFFHSLRAVEYVIQKHVVGTNKDQIRGRIKEAKGKLKEAAGKLLGNERLQTKGRAQKTLGKAQAKFGDVKQQVKDKSKKGR
jgi:uncharacterized protein YjbJ (UPF0337 family)